MDPRARRPASDSITSTGGVPGLVACAVHGRGFRRRCVLVPGLKRAAPSSGLKTMTVTVATLGFPRIGPRRELKFALEKFWSGKTDETALATAAAGLRTAAWASQDRKSTRLNSSH